MKTRRLAVTGVALVALAGLSACDDKKAPVVAPSVAATTEAAPTAAERELVAAASKLSASSATIHTTMAGGMVGDGVFDSKKKLLDMRIALAGLGDVAVRQIGTDLYLKYSGAAAKNFGNGKWMHIDAAKMPAGSALSPARIDPRNSAKLLTASTGVKKTGSAYTGTIDVGKAPAVSTDMLKALGGTATEVPFTARIGSGGYLTAITLDVDSAVPGAGKIAATYSDIGAKVTVATPPAKQTVEMPQPVLTALGG